MVNGKLKYKEKVKEILSSWNTTFHSSVLERNLRIFLTQNISVWECKKKIELYYHKITFSNLFQIKEVLPLILIV